MENIKTESLKSIYKRLTALVIFGVLVGVFYYFWMTQLNVIRKAQFLGKGNLLVVLVYGVVLFAMLCALGGFQVGSSKAANLVLSQVISLILTNLLAWAQTILIIGDIWHMVQIAEAILAMTAVDVLVCIILSNLFAWGYRKMFPPYQMLLITGYHKNRLSQKVSARDDKYQICEEISIKAGMEQIKEKILAYDVILMNDVGSDEKSAILKFCFQHSRRLYFTPHLTDVLTKGADEVDLFDSPLLLCKNFGLSIEQRFVKRLMDIIISLLAIILLSPVMLLIAAGIKFYDGGSVFFLQERCTRGGRRFMMCKFRSMIENAEEDGKSRPAVDDDDRITPVGHMIRATRLDELPQLFNILKGDMSIVGPRPERVEHVEKYTKEIPEFAFRMKVKGGLTGYAQIYGKYNTTAYDKLKMDLKYIVSYSVLLDIKIILMTLKVMFMKESTEGFASETEDKEE